MNRGLAFIVAILVLVVGGLILYFSGEGVEGEIRERTQSYLDDNVSQPVKLDVDGRAITLTSSQPVETLAQAVDEIDAMPGMRRPVVVYDPAAFPKPPFDPMTLAYNGYLSPSAVLVEADVPAGLDAEDMAKVEATKQKMADYLVATRPQVTAGDFKLENGLFTGMAKVPAVDPASAAVDNNLPAEFQRGLVVLNAQGPAVLAKLEGSELELSDADRSAILGVKPWAGYHRVFVTPSDVEVRGTPPQGAGTEQIALVEEESALLQGFAEGMQDKISVGAFVVSKGELGGFAHTKDEQEKDIARLHVEQSLPTGVKPAVSLFFNNTVEEVVGEIDRSGAKLSNQDRVSLLGVPDWSASYAVLAMRDRLEVSAQVPEDATEAHVAKIEEERAQLETYFTGLQDQIDFGRFDVVDARVNGTAQAKDPLALSNALAATRPEGLENGDLDLTAKGLEILTAFRKEPILEITPQERAQIMSVDLVASKPVATFTATPDPVEDQTGSDVSTDSALPALVAPLAATSLPALKLETLDGKRVMTGSVTSKEDFAKLQALFPEIDMSGVIVDAASPTGSGLVSQISEREDLFAGLQTLDFGTADGVLSVSGQYSDRAEFDLLKSNVEQQGGLTMIKRGSDMTLDGTLRLSKQIADLNLLFPNAVSKVSSNLGSSAGAIANSKLDLAKPWLRRIGNYDATITDAGIEIRAYPSNEEERAALAELMEQPCMMGPKPAFDVVPNFDALGMDLSGLSDEDRSAGWMSRLISFSPGKERCRRQFNRALSEGKVLFESGSANIDASSAAFLERLVQLSKICLNNTGLKMIIDGHTDSSGDAEANKSLSNKRAIAVRWHLVQAGLDENSIEAYGYGEEFPIADNETPEGREQNRRIEIKIED